MKLPRIPKNKGFLGPEYSKCSGSGMRPIIYHCANEKWVVGPMMLARMVVEKGGHYSIKRIHKFGLQKVYVYKNRSSALERFVSLCNGIIEFNESK